MISHGHELLLIDNVVSLLTSCNHIFCRRSASFHRSSAWVSTFNLPLLRVEVAVRLVSYLIACHLLLRCTAVRVAIHIPALLLSTFDILARRVLGNRYSPSLLSFVLDLISFVIFTSYRYLIVVSLVHGITLQRAIICTDARMSLWIAVTVAAMCHNELLLGNLASLFLLPSQLALACFIGDAALMQLLYRAILVWPLEATRGRLGKAYIHVVTTW